MEDVVMKRNRFWQSNVFLHSYSYWLVFTSFFHRLCVLWASLPLLLVLCVFLMPNVSLFWFDLDSTETLANLPEQTFAQEAPRDKKRESFIPELCLHHHSNHVVIVTTFWVVLSPELHLSLLKWLTTLSLTASPIASNFHYYKKSDERIPGRKQFQGILIRSALTPEIGKIRLEETKIK